MTCSCGNLFVIKVHTIFSKPILVTLESILHYESCGIDKHCFLYICGTSEEQEAEVGSHELKLGASEGWYSASTVLL
jgi:hypothetical protein